MRKTFVTIIAIVILAASCKDRKDTVEQDFWVNPAQTDLKDIIKRGTIRAVVDNSSTSYYIYRGRRMGYEYELLQNLAKHLGVQLRLVITDDLDEAFKFLNQGKADIIAINLEMSEERKNYAAFTESTNRLSTVLVQRANGELLTDLSQLNQKTVHLRSGSIYIEQLEAVRDTLQMALEIIEVQESSEKMVIWWLQVKLILLL